MVGRLAPPSPLCLSPPLSASHPLPTPLSPPCSLRSPRPSPSVIFAALTLSPTLAIAHPSPSALEHTLPVPPTCFRSLTRNEARQLALLLTQHLWPVRSAPKGLMSASIALAEDLHAVGIRWDKHRRVMGLHLRGVWEEGCKLRQMAVGGMGGMELYVQGSFLSIAEEPHPLDPTPLALEVKPASIAALPKLTLQAGLASTLPALPEPALNPELNHLLFHAHNDEGEHLGDHGHHDHHGHHGYSHGPGHGHFYPHLPHLLPAHAVHGTHEPIHGLSPDAPDLIVHLHHERLDLDASGGTVKTKGKTTTTTTMTRENTTAPFPSLGDSPMYTATFDSDGSEEVGTPLGSEKAKGNRWIGRKHVGLTVVTDG